MSLGRKRSRRVTVCLRCRNLKLHEARGLCKCCYNHLAEHRCRTGESLDDYPCTGGYGTAVGLDRDPTADAKRIRAHFDPRSIGHRESDVLGVAPSSSQILAGKVMSGSSPEDIDLHLTVQTTGRTPA